MFAGAAGLTVISWVAAKSHTAPVPSTVGDPPPDLAGQLSHVAFMSSDGLTLRGWISGLENSKGTVILLHWYRGDRRLMLERARFLMEAGYNVLLYDARGTGESEGDRISLGYLERADLRGALTLVRDRFGGPIALLGISQGGATILMSASELGEDVKAVICESTYDTLQHAADRRFRHRVGLPGWLAGILYRPFMEQRLGFRTADANPIDHIRQLPCPVFILSGEQDTRTWASDTQRLYDAAREPKQLWLIPGADHEDLYAFTPGEYALRMRAFLDNYMPQRDRYMEDGSKRNADKFF